MFADLLRRAATQSGSSPAIRHGQRILTYRALYERSCRLANALRTSGLKPGDKVASLGRNCLESMEEITGVAVAGMVRVPLYMHDTVERQADLLERAEVSALMVERDAWVKLQPILESRGADLKLILVRGQPDSTHARSYEQALQTASTADPDVRVDPDSTYVIRFTAGTTGLPKPIAHSCRAYLAAGNELALVAGSFDDTDVYLAVSPYSHGSGNLVWPCIAGGACHIVMQGFDPAEALALIEQYNCTTLFLVPTMIQRLLTEPSSRTRRLKSLRRIFYGAAPIPSALIESSIELFGDVLYQLYGQSEIVPLTALGPKDHRAGLNGAAARLRSAGRATPNSFVRIEAADGRVLPAGEVGEIVATGPGQMLGVFRDREATAERLTADGWVKTRDVGYLDEAGYLFVLDRTDDIIISGGFNIAPAEIENALTSHPTVLETVVFGIPHPQWGATPMAVVRLREGQSAQPQELIDWCRTRVGDVKKPGRILLVTEPLPVNTAGKLLRRAAREQYAADVISPTGR